MKPADTRARAPQGPAGLNAACALPGGAPHAETAGRLPWASSRGTPRRHRPLMRARRTPCLPTLAGARVQPVLAGRRASVKSPPGVPAGGAPANSRRTRVVCTSLAPALPWACHYERIRPAPAASPRQHIMGLGLRGRRTHISNRLSAI